MGYIMALFALSFIFFLCERILNKKNFLSTLILATALLFLVGFNSDNADFGTYQLRYHEIQTNTASSSMQWAFVLFETVCVKLNFEFETYRFIYYLIGFLILLVYSLKYTKNSYIFWIFYAIFTMIIDSTQMKNFMAMVFLTIALPQLCYSAKKNKIIFISLVLVAAGFHTAAYVYLPLIFVADVTANKKIRGVTLTIIFVFSLLFSNKITSSMLSSFILDTMNGELYNRTEKFFTTNMRNGYLVYFLATAVVIFITYRLNKYVKDKNIDSHKKKLINVALYCSLYSISFLPLYLYAQDFSRLLRNFFPTIHIAIVIAIDYLFDKEMEDNAYRNSIYLYKRLKLSFAYLVFLTYMFYWDIAVYWDTVITPFFDDNLLF